jgi:SAM-dependent methyltransferase
VKRVAPLHVARRSADDFLDWLRFRLDTFPRNVAWLRAVDYQELPWIGLRVSRGYRPKALETRWQEILPLLKAQDVRTAVDVGSNSGWFLFKLADQGISAVGVEGDVRLVRMTLFARKRVGATNVNVLVMHLDPRNVGLLPRADGVLFLSVWHHFVRDYGLDEAGKMLTTLWAGTRKVLFFETGEEMPSSWGLPAMTPTAREWLTAYLSDRCAGGRVDHLGRHETVAPDDVRRERSLFAVIREEMPS